MPNNAVGIMRVRNVAILLVLGAAALGLYLRHRAAEEQQLAQERLHDVHQLLAEDRPAGLRRLLEVAHAAHEDAPGSAEIEASAAYAGAILALEYHVPELAKEARGWLAQLARSPQEGRQTDLSATYVRCAEALMVWADGDLEQARAELSHLGGDEMQGAYPALEALRLSVATRADTAQLDAAATRLENALSDEARGWVYLGMFALGRNETARAQKAFERARLASPTHIGARMGQLWLTLGDNRPDHDHNEVSSVSHEVDAVLADETLAGPERAMALVVRARAHQLEGESNLALRDIAEAQHVCPGHPFLALPDVLPRPNAKASPGEKQPAQNQATTP